MRRIWAAFLLILIISISVYFVIRPYNLPPPSTSSLEPTSTSNHSPTQKMYDLKTVCDPEEAGGIERFPVMDKYPTDTRIALTAIPNDCYTFDRWEIDGTLKWEEPITITMDSDKNVTAHFQKEHTKPPVISEVDISKYSDISATITWKTDEAVTGKVEYGKTESFGKNEKIKCEPAEAVFECNISITDLEPNTTYYFSIKSQDKCGNENAQPTTTRTFTTLSSIPSGYEVGKRALDLPQLTYWKDPNPYDTQSPTPNTGQKSPFSQSDFRGKKIMLNFWNTFCGACIGEFPLMRQIYEGEKFADRNSKNSDFVVITICIDGRIDEAPERIKGLEEKYKEVIDKYFGELGNLTFPILLDIGGEAKQNYHIGSIPETVFIDSDGIIREIKIGRFNSLTEVADILERLD